MYDYEINYKIWIKKTKKQKQKQNIDMKVTYRRPHHMVTYLQNTYFEINGFENFEVYIKLHIKFII